MIGHQVFIRKKQAFDVASRVLSQQIEKDLHIQTTCVIYALYEVEGLDSSDLVYFQQEVLGDKVTDEMFNTLETSDCSVIAYTLLAGHFDQRAYYAHQAGSLVLERGSDFSVHSSTVLVFDSILPECDREKIKSYVINPADTRERSLSYEKSTPPAQKHMKSLSEFTSMNPTQLMKLKDELGLAMSIETCLYIQDYYKKTKKTATETELLVFDTYWSDHCRHTTFITPIGTVTYEGTYKEAIEASFNKYCNQRTEIGRSGEISLMDLATHSQRYLKEKGKLSRVENSEEVNACSIYVTDEHGEYLLMFKNETHNHPTEIEPFGGAQTCLGGAIRDPLSGRSFVYQGIRISGAADPTTDISQTLHNKLPQSTIVREAARGFSSYGNQIGLATTLVREMYHPSYVAKHFELGAVVGITKKDEVLRANPIPGDIVVLLGGRTGKDGIGGASGSSVSHTSQSLDTSYAQIQKGNPLEERKLQRLFRIPEVTSMIKRSNDFGAGGVSVAIGELAPGISIDLDAIPLKAQGMNASEIAISESQERMAVVIAEADLEQLLIYAKNENVEASKVALITKEPRLVMKHNGHIVVNLDRSFLDTNGSLPTQNIVVDDLKVLSYNRDHYIQLNRFSQKGLGEIFDSSVGNSTLFSPYGGNTQSTPELSSVQRFPLHASSNKASVVSYGFDPVISEQSPYLMGMYAVLSSVAKHIATGARLEDTYLSFQEYFPKLGNHPERWGLVLQALLGAFEMCDALTLASIGGKDSMSGSYENLDVIPTLVSFAFGEVSIERLRSRAFKAADENIYVLEQKTHEGMPDIECFKRHIEIIEQYRADITSISTLDEGLKHTLDLMSFGNEIGYDCSEVSSKSNPGGFVFTTSRRLANLEPIGRTTASFNPHSKRKHLNGLESIYPIAKPIAQTSPPPAKKYSKRYYHTAIAKPKVLILTFSGTNSELDMEMNFTRAGGETHVFVVNDTSHTLFEQSVVRFIHELSQSHILVLPGGFSYSDEPDGSGKFITAFLKNKKIRAAVDDFVSKDHLILGICNGFQGLIKSGLLPYGVIHDRNEDDPTLFFNDSYRHIAKLVNTRIHSLRSPWLQDLDSEIIYTLPISHSEGKFVANESQLRFLVQHDLIATTYVDNPNGSVMNIEGIVSPQGNILGKMAHNERIREDLFLNVPGCKRQDIFMSGIQFFTKGGA